MNYCAVTIGKQIRDIIKTSHAASLGLAICAFGSLTTLPKQPLEPSIPAVFVAVRNVPSDEQTIATASSHVRVKYNYDILYLRPFAEDEESYAEAIDDAEGIAETLMGDRKLSGLKPTNASIVNSGVTQISYDEGTTRFFNDVIKLRCDVVIIGFVVDVQAVR